MGALRKVLYSMFLFCLNTNIKEAATRPIRLLAPAALGVYLIHAHPFVFEHILKDAFGPIADKPAVIMVPCVFGATLLVFAVCAALELLRIRIFKLIRVEKLCEVIANQCNRLYYKFFG